MNGKALRIKRATADLTGQDVCNRANITRSRLSAIENGYINATPAELERVSAAIDAIVSTRQQVERMAATAGLSLAGVL